MSQKRYAGKWLVPWLRLSPSPYFYPCPCTGLCRCRCPVHLRLRRSSSLSLSSSSLFLPLYFVFTCAHRSDICYGCNTHCLRPSSWTHISCVSFRRCAKAANMKGYTHFSIQNFGDCWSGPQANKTYLRDGVQAFFSQKPAAKPWMGCVDRAYKQCQPGSSDCVGQDKSNSVYTFDNSKSPFSVEDLVMNFSYICTFFVLASV